MLGFKNFNFAGGQSTRIADASAPASKSFGSITISSALTFDNWPSSRGVQFMGVRSGVYFYVAARSQSTTLGGVDLVKYNGSTMTVSSYTNGVTVLPYTSDVATSYNSTNVGGQYMAGWHVPSASAPLIELMPGYVTNWATTPTTASTLTNGTVTTATATTTQSQFFLAMCNSQRSANSGLFRPGWFYKSASGTISFRNATIPSVSNTVTLRAALTSIQTGLSSTQGNYLSASGFDTDSDTNYAYVVGYVGATNTVYSTKVVVVNGTTVRISNNLTNQLDIGVITTANIDTVRDTYATGTGTDSTYVICITSASKTLLQAVTVSNWNSFTATPTVGETGSYDFLAVKPRARVAAIKGKKGSAYVISRASSTTFEAQEIAVALDGTISLVGTPHTLTTSVASLDYPFSAEVILDGTTEVIAIQYLVSGASRIGIWKTV